MACLGDHLTYPKTPTAKFFYLRSRGELLSAEGVEPPLDGLQPCVLPFGRRAHHVGVLLRQSL